MITFNLDIDPIAKGRPRFDRRGHAYTPKETRAFENVVRLMAYKFRPLPMYQGPVKFTATFYMKPPIRKKYAQPIVKPDWDNLGKMISDSLNGIFWKDDSQIVDARIRKVYDWATRKTGIQITVEEIT